MLDAFVANLLPPTRHLTELDRLIGMATRAHIASRRALAAAIAEEAGETRRREAFAAKAKDLEARAVAALSGGREDLAVRAAESIAVLETEIAASDAAAVRFAARVALARRAVEAERRRLADLERGRRLARIGAALTDGSPAGDGLTPLTRAEAALARVEAEQAEAEAVRVAFAPEAATLTDDLAEAGFGAPTHVRAQDVLARLRALAAPPAAITQD